VRIVVCDTGPVLHLREAGVLDVLRHAGEVLIPAAVDDELTRLVDDWAAARPAWLVRRALDPAAAPSPTHHLATGLGAGETEAILLARQLDADWLLTDDAEARIIAGLAGLEVHGSLGVLLWAAAQRHLDHAQADAALTRLAQSSLWLSPAILTEARNALRTLSSAT
jgi:predicted nucleic acid-binding protein